MDALEILNKFIESGSPPDILSTEWPDGRETKICFSWICGTILYLDYDGEDYKATWNRFQVFWTGWEREFNAESAENAEETI